VRVKAKGTPTMAFVRVLRGARIRYSAKFGQHPYLNFSREIQMLIEYLDITLLD
jgi:hypothetical protein